MAVLKCKMCGGDLNVTEGMKVAECEFCATQQTVPSGDDDKKTNLFNRANHLRLANEFDRAAAIFESIVNEFPNEAEAYWGLVLCKYGIEYVDDPVTGRKIPTCHRTSYDSIFNDVNYMQALDNADSVAQDVYKREADTINNIQKGILDIVKNEEPFDVFICYKESDDSGARTQDSVLAQDLYYQITKEGFKVFFARITLEGKLGTAYEPYIFAALNSAKVMVVVGTKPEYYNAVWVKNEWSRFLDMMKKDSSKILIPAYKDMDPYDLPDALSMFQAQDMSKLGFMQDLIRGISKLAGKQEAAAAAVPVQQVISAASLNSNVENLLKRGYLALEDSKWNEADGFFEQVLNENVEEPRAYLGKLMAELEYQNETDFYNGAELISGNDNFQKAYRFGDKSFQNKLYEYSIAACYNAACRKMEKAESELILNDCIEYYENALIWFKTAIGYKDSEDKISKCQESIKERKYSYAIVKMEKATNEDILNGCIEDYEYAAKLFNEVSEYNDASIRADECRKKIVECKENSYQKACAIFLNPENMVECDIAKKIFEYLGDYKDSKLKINEYATLSDLLNKYQNACSSFAVTKNINDCKFLIKVFTELGDFKESKDFVKKCNEKIEYFNRVEKEMIYQKACKIAEKEGEYVLREAIENFDLIPGYKDADIRKRECENRIIGIKGKSKNKKILTNIVRVVVVIVIVSLFVVLYNFLFDNDNLNYNDYQYFGKTEEFKRGF